MSHSAPADGTQKHSSDTTWELVPLPPITYHAKTSALPSMGDGDGRAFSGGASPAEANADASTTATRTRKRKRPVCLTLPATIGREFLVRSALSACDRCNVVGRKRIKRGGKSGGKDAAAAAAAADTTSTLCRRCQNIYNGGKYLSKQMARFDLIAAGTAEEGPDGMEGSGDTIRLSALGSNAVAIQINKIPIHINDQHGKAEAIVKQGDIVSFLLNPRGVRDEKDCAAAAAAAATGSSRSVNAVDIGGKQSKEEEFWSMRFSVVQSKCVGEDSQNGESDCRSEQRKGRPRESETVLDHEEKRKGGVDEGGECDPKSPHLSDHQDDGGDDHEEELDETPVLSMHHFSATQWQNQSAMDITSMVADTPYTYDEDDDDDDEDDNNDNDSESDTSPALGGNKANNSPSAKKGEFGVDQDSIDEDNGRDLSSFSIQELKKLRDRFNTVTATGVPIAAKAAGAGPAPSNTNEISASFHRALFSMAIRHEEKSIVHDDDDDEEDRRTARRAKPGASSEEEDDDEGRNGHNDTLCDQEILLPKLLEYTTIVE